MPHTSPLTARHDADEQPCPAEQPVKPRHPAELPAGFATLRALVNELQVYKLELELQNAELRDVRAQVQEGRERYAAFYDFSPTGFASLTPDSSILELNCAGARLLQRERTALLNARFDSFVAQADLPIFNDFLNQVFATNSEQSCEVTLAANTPDAPAVLQMQATRAVDGQLCWATLTDITEHKRAHAKQDLAASVFTHAREAIAITDARGTIIETNDAFTEITGYTRQEVLGRHSSILRSGHQSPSFYGLMWKVLHHQGHWSGEVWHRRKGGEVYPARLTISAVRDAAAEMRNFVALFSDITSIKAHEDELEHLAHFDPLTGLPNRLLKRDRLRQAMAQCRRHGNSLAVAYLDIDNFKPINDRYGHEVGDALLVELSKRMSAALREGDTLARIGGDEFVAVIVDLPHPQDVYPLVERLLQAAYSKVRVPTQPAEGGVPKYVWLQVSASIGLTFYPGDNADADVLLRHADQAMYCAKQEGRNRYRVFDPTNEAKMHTHQENLSETHRALDAPEFALYYQPKVNLRTGQVTGTEALTRGGAPTQGLLSPAGFLLGADGEFLSVDIGEWVTATALAQGAHWHQGGRACPRPLPRANFAGRPHLLLLVQPEAAPVNQKLG